MSSQPSAASGITSARSDHSTLDLKSIEFLRAHLSGFQPRVGIVLGSGLGDLAHQIVPTAIFDFHEIPGFPTTHVSGHAGKLILGDLAGTPVAALQGRCHLYEGWRMEQALVPVQTLIDLDIDLLILSNASGGINPRFRSGQVVLMDSHIDGMFRLQPQLFQSKPNDGILSRNVTLYDRTWIERAQQTAIKLGFALTTGTYWATLGPNYETRSEYRMFRNLGADMVGMSTVPEAKLAFDRNIPVLAFSIVTNVANSDNATVTDHADVLNWSSQAKGQLVPLIESLLSEYFPPSSAS